MTGSPIDKAHGTRMTGMDSLLVSVPVRLKDLPGLLEQYLARFNATDYKSAFSWIDNLAEVRDASVRKKLNVKMLDALRSEHPSQRSTWLAVPEVVDWVDIGGFRFRGSQGAQLFPDLRVTDFMTTVADPKGMDVDTLKHRHVFVWDAADESCINQWTVYACIYCEVEHEGATYVLSGGTWYRVNRDFVTTINQDVTKLVSASWLPPYKDKSETLYNERVAQSSGGKFALADRKLVRFGGTSIEFCDLYAPNQLIHVKKYGSSAVLSHLFAQGSVSGDCFLEEADFRRRVNKILPPRFKIAKPAQRPDARDYEIVYAVISRSPKSIDQSLPFFSRLHLRNTARRLQRYGYKVSLTKIQA